MYENHSDGVSGRHKLDQIFCIDRKISIKISMYVTNV